VYQMIIKENTAKSKGTNIIILSRFIILGFPCD